MLDLSVHIFRRGRGLEIVLGSFDCWRTKRIVEGFRRARCCGVLSSRCGGVIAFQCCVILLLVACLCWRFVDARPGRACSRVRASLGMS